MWILLMVTLIGTTPIDRYPSERACEDGAKVFRDAFPTAQETYVCKREDN